MIDTCPDDAALQATLVVGDTTITLHLDSCPRCRQRLAELKLQSTQALEGSSATSVTTEVAASSCPDEATLLILPEEGPLADHVAGCSRCQERRSKLSAADKIGQDSPTLSAEVNIFAHTSRLPRMPANVGKYQVVETLGEGGQAIVFRAVHPTLGKDVVIKLAHKPAQSGQSSMLVTEGKLLAKLNHANLVRVHDLDFHEDKPFLVMEYVRGGSLEAQTRAQPPTPRQAAWIVACIARAVASAHKVGIVHLDIKPANILVDESGAPLLADFGMARLRWVLDEDKPTSIGGTPRYMAPEQARGDNEQIGPASDLYALGGVLYFLLSGKDPRGGSSILEVMDKSARGEIDWAPLAGAPKALQAICRRALALRPQDRYPSAEALAEELEKFARWHGRRRFMVAAAALAGLAAFGLFYFWPRGPVPVPTDTQLLIADVQRGKAHVGELSSALPLATGDSFQVRCDVPRGYQAALLFIDAEGGVEVFDKSLRQAHAPYESVVFPAKGSFRLGELEQVRQGTAVLVVVAAPRLPAADELKAALGERWPRLPRNLLVWLTAQQTGVKSFDQRGMQVVEGDVVHDVEARLEKVRQALPGLFLAGIAFPRIDRN